MEPGVIQGKSISIDEYYQLFDFKMKKIGIADYGDIAYYLIDSFKIVDTNVTKENIALNGKYIVAMDGNMVYRIKGFSINDFPFLLKRYLEIDENSSVVEILDFLDVNYNYDDELYIDFECLYEAFRVKEINYDKHPCLESVLHSQNVSVVMGYNNKVWVKKGGEPLGYRGSKMGKKYLIKQ